MLQPVPFKEHTRRLQDTAFAASSVLTLPLPKDCVLRFLLLRLVGSIQTTFAAGSPAAPRESTFDTLVNNIQVTVNGDTVKSVRPHLLHMLEIMAYGQEGERKSSAGAAAATGNNPTADGGFAWGTTTQYTTVAEAICIPFECILADSGRGLTWLDLRGVSSAEVKMSTGAYSSLDTTGATITYANASFNIEAYTVEARLEDKNTPLPGLMNWKQSYRQETLSSSVTEKQWDVNRANKLIGIGIFAKDGASPSVPNDLALTNIKLMAGGSELVKQGTFIGFQTENRQQYAVNAARSSNVSRFDGFAYINLLTAKDLNSAFDASRYDSMYLLVDSRSSGVTYGLTVTLETHELTPVRR